MPRVLLFCLAEQAKTFVRTALGAKNPWGDVIFYLVESSNVPSEGQEFRTVLADHESFESDFIGASEHDCRRWVLEHQYQNNMIEQNILAIADQRSARDDTLSIQFYRRDPGHDFGDLGILPPEPDTWYTFRVIYHEANNVHVALSFLEPDIGFPVYFGRKDELTDKRGIFNVAKATELCNGGPGA